MKKQNNLQADYPVRTAPSGRCPAIPLFTWLIALAIPALTGCSSSSPVLIERLGSERFSSDGDSTYTDARAREELSRKGATTLDSETEFQFLRGELLLSEEKVDEALGSYLRAAARLKEPSLFLTKRIAQLYIRAGKLKDAITQMEAYRSLGQSDFELLELLGGAYSAAQQFDKAEAVYRELIDSSNGKTKEDATIYLVTVLAQSGRVAEAKTLLGQQLKVNPKSGIAHYYLAKMHELSNDLSAAEQEYRAAIKVSPVNDGLSLELARVLAVQRKVPEATEVVKKIVARSPQNQQARQILAQLLLANDDIESALKQFEQLEEQGSPDTRIKIALLKLERRDFLGAQADLSLIVAEDPLNIAARYYLALAYAGEGRVDEVMKTVREIPPSEKVYVESRLLTAFLLRQNKRFEEAVAFLSETKLHVTDVRILNFLTSLLKETGRAEEAVKTQREIVELEPDKDVNHFMLAVLLHENGDFKESIKAGERAIELNPKNADALNFVGYSLAERGERLKDAEKLIQRAIEIEPANGYFIDSLGWAYFQQERYSEALPLLERAVELVPSDAVILEHLAWAQEKMGMPDKALQTAKRALVEAPNSDDKNVQVRLQEMIERLEQR